MIAFTIIGEPVSHKNGYHIVTIGKRPAIVKSKEALAYERDALRQISPAAKQRIEGPVRVSLRLFYASERPDMDESLILDVLQDRWGRRDGPKGTRVLLQAGVYRNDRQVREKHVFWALDKKTPRVEIEIQPLQAQQSSLLSAAMDSTSPVLEF
jgi:Holliday junction resolvase RusA-like endonuclease